MIKKVTTKMIIVGNGTPTRGAGSVIDSFDVVARLNKFVIDGFENDVGSRTDVVGLNGILSIPRGASEIWFPQPRACIKKANLRRAVNARIETFEEYPTIVEEWRARGLSGSPSTGLRLIAMVISRLGKVWITGFDSGATGHYWDETHVHGDDHDWDFERKEISRLKKIELINDIQGNRTFKRL